MPTRHSAKTRTSTKISKLTVQRPFAALFADVAIRREKLISDAEQKSTPDLDNAGEQTQSMSPHSAKHLSNAIGRNKSAWMTAAIPACLR